MRSNGNSVRHSYLGTLNAGGMIETLRRLLRLWHRRQTTRHQLARLNARELADIGCDPLTAEREAAKPFWMA